MGDVRVGAERAAALDHLLPFAPVRTDRWAGRWFVAVLMGLFVVGVALRIVFALTAATPLDTQSIGDQYYYRTDAASLADGHGLTEPVDGKYVASAAHAPGLSVVLAAGDLVGLRSDTEQRVVMSIVCAVGVVLVGLVGRRLGGPTVGLVAALIASLHPGWVQAGPDLLSEGLYMVAISAAMLAALWFLDRPGWWRARSSSASPSRVQPWSGRRGGSSCSRSASRSPWSLRGGSGVGVSCCSARSRSGLPC